jgi:hypothetical protein
MKITNYYIDGKNVLHTFIGNLKHITFKNVYSEDQAKKLIAEENKKLKEKSKFLK